MNLHHIWFTIQTKNKLITPVPVFVNVINDWLSNFYDLIDKTSFLCSSVKRALYISISAPSFFLALVSVHEWWASALLRTGNNWHEMLQREAPASWGLPCLRPTTDSQLSWQKLLDGQNSALIWLNTAIKQLQCFRLLTR